MTFRTLVSVVVLSLATTACSDWTLTSSAGRSCRAEKGMSQEDLRRNCGAPDGIGIRPNVMGGLDGLTPCVGDCDRYGRKVVIYACNRKVIDVSNLAGATQCQGIAAGNKN